jgi:FixJ family two-component response regulator
MSNHPPKLFVVDDDESVRKALRRLFQCFGMQTETYANAEDFLEQAEPKGPGCLILDAHLPGSSGLCLQSRLLTEHPNLRVLFVSGDSDERLRETALAQGAVASLSKPFKELTIVETVFRALELDSPI